MLIRQGLEYAPKFYEQGMKMIKNQRIRNTLQSYFANCAVNQGTGLTRQRFT